MDVQEALLVATKTILYIRDAVSQGINTSLDVPDNVSKGLGTDSYVPADTFLDGQPRARAMPTVCNKCAQSFLLPVSHVSIY